MQNQVDYPEADRMKINDDIIGKNGIICRTYIDTFYYRLNNLRTAVTEKDGQVDDKKFMPYFDNKLLPLLHEHLIGPVRSGKGSVAWTNNNCERANHVLKTATKWKQQDMPKLIVNLYDIVKGDQEDRCRAIRGSGSYKPDDRHKHHLMDISQWETLSTEAQKKQTKRFLTDTVKPTTNTVVSTGGTRTAQKTPSAGRKPGQYKRKCAERSRTPAAKRNKKIRVKSRECHNHKPQPFPNTKRKRKPTNPNKHKSNKRTKSTKISALFPKRGNRNTKRTVKHKNKMTHGKTYKNRHVE